MNKKIFLIAAISLVPLASADSLFTQVAAKNGTMIAEKTARFKPGDILTVMVRERIDASTSANTNTKKESDVNGEADESDNAFLVSDEEDGGFGLMNPAQLPNWALESKNETKNTGNTKRESELTTAVTCTVLEVFENGTMLIEGNRKVTMNREDSVMFLRGIIRSKDVSPANSILSTQVANLEVSLSGKGPLWNNQRRGLVTRALDWVSPF